MSKLMYTPFYLTFTTECEKILLLGGICVKKEMSCELKAGLLLGGMATFTLIFLFMMFIPNPANFIFWIGFNETAWEIPLAWVLALAVSVAYIAYTAFGIPTVRQNLFKFNLLKVVGIFAAFTSGLIEEIVFRRMLMDWLYTVNVDVVLQVLLSGMAFGITHFVWALFAKNWRVGVGAVIPTTVLGLLLAIVYLVAGRNVLPTIMAHTLINLFIEPWLILHAVKEKKW